LNKNNITQARREWERVFERLPTEESLWTLFTFWVSLTVFMGCCCSGLNLLWGLAWFINCL